MEVLVTAQDLPEQLVPEAGGTIVIQHNKASKECLPPYTLVGNGHTSSNGTSRDIVEVCMEMNQAELKLLQFMRESMIRQIMNKSAEPSVIVPADYVEYSKYLATAMAKNYEHLEYLEVLKRIKRGTYILNPNLILPPRHYAAMQSKWVSTPTRKKI